MTSRTAHRPGRNLLLDLLPPDETARLAPHIVRVKIGLREVVYEADAPIEFVYFPRSGVMSILALLSDGASCEVGLAGYEGMIHVLTAFGAKTSPHRVFCQVTSEADRLPAGVFRDELARDGLLPQVINAYLQYMSAQLSQTTVCNRHHNVSARGARWLAMTHDRVESDQFPMTHEFLSLILGIRRPSVTIAMAALQKAGLISYTRGRVTVLDRAGLEALACECYPVIRQRYDFFMGSVDRNIQKSF